MCYPLYFGVFTKRRKRVCPTSEFGERENRGVNFYIVDDLTAGLIFLLKVKDPPDWVNLGTGKDQTILELAGMVKDTVGFKGSISHDLSKPDGTPVKRLDVTLMDSLGWRASIDLRSGIPNAYEDFLSTLASGTARL